MTEPEERPVSDDLPAARPLRAYVETHLGDVDELADLRGQVGDLTTASGFSRHGRRRAVLAVHEAAVVACRLLSSGSTDGRRERCTVRMHSGPGLMVVEIDLPRPFPFPTDLRDGDPLRFVRTFAVEAGWTGSLRVRRLRLVARDDR